jgi:phosphatidylserine synthase
MQAQTSVDPYWAALTVWVVVNAVNLLQAAGFISRVRTGGSMAINHILGYVMIALAVPAAVALVAFVLAGAGWLYWLGPALYLAFIALEIVIDYVRPVEFRSPRRPEILVPYLLLFFGAILLMGIQMFNLDRGLWLVTVATTVLLLTSMGIAMRKGVG